MPAVPAALCLICRNGKSNGDGVNAVAEVLCLPYRGVDGTGESIEADCADRSNDVLPQRQTG